MMRLALLLALIFIPAPAFTARPVIVAHRGLGSGPPENTLAAFRHAIDQRVAVIELDLRATADGAIVVLHDASVDRTTNGRGNLAAMTLAEVRNLDAGVRAGPNYAGERIPTFAEVLALIHGRPTRVLLDIKRGGGIDLAALAREITSSGVSAQVIAGVRSLDDLRMIRALAPDLATLAFIPESSAIAAFADGGAETIRLWSDWVEREPGLIEAIHRRGRKAWIVIGRRLPHKPAQWIALHRRLEQAGVDGIITDRPDLVEPAP